MKLKTLCSFVGGTLLCAMVSYSVTALAEQAGSAGGPPRISAEKMEAIRACASAKGVELPAPPQGQPPEGKPPEGKPPEEGKGSHPKLTEAQRAIVDACFEANGVTPPKERPHNGSHGMKSGSSTPGTEE